MSARRRPTSEDARRARDAARRALAGNDTEAVVRATRDLLPALDETIDVLRLHETLMDPIGQIDMTGRFTAANEAFRTLLGYTEDDLEHLTARDITPPEYHETDARIIEEQVLVRGYSDVFEKELIRKDGTRVPVELRKALLRDDAGEPIGMWSLVREITARRQGEVELLRTKFCLDQASLGIYRVSPDGTILDANEHACRSLGYSREELLGKSLFTIDGTFDPETWREHRRKVRSLGSRTIETVHVRKDGTRFPVEVTVNHREFRGEGFSVSFVRDISNQKLNEERLRESEERLRLALMGSSQGIYDLDIRTGEAKFSPEYATMLGYDPDSFVESNARWIERLHPDDHDRVVAHYEACIDGREPEYRVEFRQRTAQGGWKWILSQGKVFARDEEGRPTRMVGTHTDISERKLAEEERTGLEAQLFQAQKMESMGRLAGGMAHDFNNMLSVILGYADLIGERLPDGDPIAPAIAEIGRAARHSRDLTRQLLAFSRRQIIAPRVLDLNVAIDETRRTLARLIDERIDLQFLPGRDLWRVKVDHSQLDQILVNLAVNARDAMPDGGTLRIETDNVRIGEPAARSQDELEPGEYVRLRVSDTGVGMTDEIREKIFEPFFTTKNIGEGTGLGLSTVYGIVRQNRGSIDVESAPGRGTSFDIHLPRAGEAERQPASSPLPLEVPIVRGAPRVLLVEDDDMVRSVTEAMLEDCGCHPILATTPSDALDICQDAGTAIDLLLTDVVMPEISGRDLRDRVARIRPDLPVLFMSGYTADIIVDNGILDEGVHFLQKPFSQQDLARKIHETLGTG